eukprot:Polyplicarium_translucidae@DN2978_c0_g1_i7.p1
MQAEWPKENALLRRYSCHWGGNVAPASFDPELGFETFFCNLGSLCGVRLQLPNLLHGKLRFADGSTYVGQVCGGQFHGPGSFCCATCALEFNGDFSHHAPHGFGTLRHVRESLMSRAPARGPVVPLLYRGGFSEGRRSGTGTLSSVDRTVYLWADSWKNDQPANGSAKLRISLSLALPLKLPYHYYRGEVRNGKPNGFGVLRWMHRQSPDIIEYAGEFASGLFSGRGKLTRGVKAALSGRKVRGTATVPLYDGSWKNGFPGDALRVLPSADGLYVGNVENGTSRSGFGVQYQRLPSDLTTGMEVNCGFSCFEALLRSAEQSRPIRLCVRGARIGTLSAVCGRVRKTKARDSSREQHHVLHAETWDSSTHDRSIAKGRPPQMERPEYYCAYEGEWQDDMPHGRGAMLQADGLYHGHFVRGKRHGFGVLYSFPGTAVDWHDYGEDYRVPIRKVVCDGWEKGKPTGLAHCVDNLGHQFQARFDEGQMVDADLQGSGVFTRRTPGVKLRQTFRTRFVDST